jgi:hypothetical protein
VQKAFLKLANSNPLLLLDDRCLRVTPIAFENQQGTISLVLKSRKLPTNNYLLKSGQYSAHHYESRPVAISPVLKRFTQVQKLLALNGLEFINSV